MNSRSVSTSFLVLASHSIFISLFTTYPLFIHFLIFLFLLPLYYPHFASSFHNFTPLINLVITLSPSFCSLSANTITLPPSSFWTEWICNPSMIQTFSHSFSCFFPIPSHPFSPRVLPFDHWSQKIRGCVRGIWCLIKSPDQYCLPLTLCLALSFSALHFYSSTVFFLYPKSNALKLVGFSSQFVLFISLAFPEQTFQKCCCEKRHLQAHWRKSFFPLKLQGHPLVSSYRARVK